MYNGKIKEYIKIGNKKCPYERKIYGVGYIGD